ncbi:MAG: phosphate/phosphite/phosphonate ABC transporter substrate-binding protein [Acidobacteriota bacterium]
MPRLIRPLMLLSLLVVGLASSVLAEEYKIGVLAKRGAVTCMQEWGPTADYLKERLGSDFAIVPLKFESIEPAVKASQIDFLIVNSAFFVEMQKKYNMQPVASLVNSVNNKPVKEFGGVVFVRADSPAQNLADLKGKSFMCVQKSSFGGGQMAQRLLLENNIDPQKDFSSYVEGGTHDNVVLAVKNGAADAGTVRTDTLERMEEEGKIKLSDFKVIHRVIDSFPFVHSTQLYPEWPMAASAKVDKAVADKVAGALMAMTSGAEAAKAAKIVGWAQPSGYDSVVECLKAIRYGVFAE